MPWDTYLRFATALVLVLGLIGLAAWLARRYGLGGRVRGKGLKSGRRLAITEVCPVDAKRRLVLVRRDEVEHLILLGTASDLVIERGISAESFREQLDQQPVDAET